MSNIGGFDRVAGYYDLLKRFVFGNAIYASQMEYLQALPKSGNILVLGGGSGEILRPLLELKPRCMIWYLEASSEMLSIAKRRVSEKHLSSIHFIHGTEESLPADVELDGLITHFFLDLFPDDRLRAICNEISGKLSANGVWIAADFIDGGKWWQRLLLKTMYRFFVVICRIEARKLPAWEAQIHSVGLRQRQFTFFYSGFIKSVVYQKNGSEN